MVRRFLCDQSGATAIEYGLIVALVALVALPILGPLGAKLSAKFALISNKLGSPTTSGG